MNRIDVFKEKLIVSLFWLRHCQLCLVQVQIRVDPLLSRLAFDWAAPCLRSRVLKQWPARDARRAARRRRPNPTMSVSARATPKENAPGYARGMSSCCGSSAFKDQRRIAGSSTFGALSFSQITHTHTHTLAGCSGRILYFNNSADSQSRLELARAFVQHFEQIPR